MGRVLAIDVGEKRVGIAVSDPSGTVARPLETLPQHPRTEHFAALAELISQEAVDLIIVGYPLSLDGTVGPQARLIARYRDALAQRVSVPVQLWDERYSTATAEDIVRRRDGHRYDPRARGRGRARHASLDAVAACVILQSFLDAQQAQVHLEAGRDGPYLLGCATDSGVESASDHESAQRSYEPGPGEGP